MDRGRVRWFNKHLGYGFITHWDGRDVFVHYSVIKTEDVKVLKENEVVNYECIFNEGRIKATHVQAFTAVQPSSIRRRTYLRYK